MSISRQNLSIVIVSFMSEEVIHDCINSIPEDIKIIVVENSGNQEFKQNIESQYKNIKCVLSSENLGMGSGNNLGLSHTSTDYALILNPDVILESNTIDELINASKNIESFAVIAPIINSKKNLNYKLLEKETLIRDNIKPFKVKSVDGFAMLLNLNKLNNTSYFKNFKYFDENIFLFLENDDLCKKLIDINENIYIAPNAKINHLGGGAVNKKFSYEIELSRNWHWIWSKFYFNKKHNGFFYAFLNGAPTFLSAIIKYIFYSILNNKKKSQIYLHRSLGYFNALIGKKSFFRPKIKN